MSSDELDQIVVTRADGTTWSFTPKKSRALGDVEGHEFHGNQWTDGKGGGKEDKGGQDNGEHPPWKDPGGFEHTGIMWKQETDPATGRPIPIKVDLVDDAVVLIQHGMVVEVPDELTARTLVNELARQADAMKAAGKEAKDFDLCQVSVKGSNLFCAESLRNVEYEGKVYEKGIPRLLMPQIGGEPVPGSEADKLPRNPWNKKEVDGAKAFVTHLQGIGVKTSPVMEVPAESLKVSQRDLVGTQVASMMNDTSFNPATNPIFVSSDNYILDGHHRWAAVVGRNLDNPKKSMMNIIKVNAPISELLHLSLAWSTKFGIKQTAGVLAQGKASGIHKAAA